jgi:hypothetical protein
VEFAAARECDHESPGCRPKHGDVQLISGDRSETSFFEREATLVADAKMEAGDCLFGYCQISARELN